MLTGMLSSGISTTKRSVFIRTISVAFILELFASGATHQDILQAYPHVPPEGVEDALRYASLALKNEYILISEVPRCASA